MSFNIGKPKSHYIFTTEEPYSPMFREHDNNGMGVVRTRQEGKDMAKRIYERTGRKVVFDPDGGLPSPEENHQRRLEDQERRKSKRRSRR